MSAPDDEFDDFLRRRKPLFDRSHDDDALEPPAELDRIVLRQARDAIEMPPHQRLYRAPRWTAPLAVAATLAVAFTVVLQFMPKHRAAQPAASEISMQPTARHVDEPGEILSAQTAARADAVADQAMPDGTVVMQLDSSAVDPAVAQELRRQREASPARAAAAPPAPDAFVSEAEANRHAEPPAPPLLAKRSAGAEADMASTAGARSRVATGAAPVAADPEYRRDEKRWMAEIQRLRASGEVARADAEYAEFQRQHRALAVSPDR